MKRQDTTVLGLAICTAFGAALLAISEHVRWMEAGYGLGAARREHQVLAREAMQAERKLAGARSPAVVAARAKAWGLGLDHHTSQAALPPSSSAAAAAPSSIADAPAPFASSPVVMSPVVMSPVVASPDASHDAAAHAVPARDVPARRAQVRR